MHLWHAKLKGWSAGERQFWGIPGRISWKCGTVYGTLWYRNGRSSATSRTFSEVFSVSDFSCQKNLTPDHPFCLVGHNYGGFHAFNAQSHFIWQGNPFLWKLSRLWPINEPKSLKLTDTSYRLSKYYIGMHHSLHLSFLTFEPPDQFNTTAMYAVVVEDRLKYEMLT